jgi:chaperonin GroES
MKTIIKPTGNNIIVEPIKLNDTTKSGLILPETVKMSSGKGKVLAIGPGKLDDKGNIIPILGIKNGDTVIYKQFTGSEIEINSDKYVVLSDSDIIATINEEE